MKKDRSGWVFLLDIVALGILLVVFALFHHVLPTKKQSLNIVSNGVSLASPEGQSDASALGSWLTGLLPGASAESETQQSSYEGDGVSITLTDELYQDGSVRYHLADIVLDDVTKLQTAFAADTYGSGFTDTVMDMDAMLDAVLCVNGDYYGNSDAGVVARNGVIYRANYTASDILCLYLDGTAEVKSYEDFDPYLEADSGLWQAWTFGPSLLDENGQALTAFDEGRHMTGRNPRTVFGYYGPGHYAILVVDGRGESAGLTLSDLSQLCETLGFSVAYNLDGGKSSVMTYGDRVVNEPAGGGRAISDFIYIKEDL